MFKFLKFICFTIFVAFSIILINAIINAKVKESNTKTANIKPPLIGDNIYLSNRYTQPEDNIQNEFLEVITEEDELIADNERFSLYVNRDDVIFKVKDKSKVNDKEYIWTSAITKVLRSDSNTNYAQMMLSSFVVEYFNIDSVTGDDTTNISKLFLHQATRNEEYYESQLADNVSVSYNIIPNGISVSINYTVDYELENKNKTANIGFTAEVTISKEGLVVNIPNETIIEDKLKIAAIYIMPFLGATRLNEVPGYMLVPDGSGALVRLNDYTDLRPRQISLKYYGINSGALDTIEQPYLTDTTKLTMPVYGIIHGVNQNGFISIIENGDYNAELLINRSGVLNIDFNWITPRFLLRDQFNLYKVNQTIEKKYYPSDITMNYVFLTNDDANYIGMAKAYQNYLVKKGILSDNKNDFSPLRLEVLASDSKKGLFGPSLQTMTTIEQINDILNDLEKNDVKNLHVVLRGWNEGGMSGNSPYNIDFESELGSKTDFNKLLNNKKHQIYLYNDYVIGYDNSDRINKRRDVARGLHRVQLEFLTPNEPVYKNYYYLNPHSSYSFINEDLTEYKNESIDKLALDSIGELLFSYYDEKEFTRIDTAKKYQDALLLLNKNIRLSLYKPNAYLWKYTKNYLDIPMYTSQHNYYTDSVPFIQIVLKGYINYYAPFSNFFVDSKTDYLLMIDYGMFPSYIITNNSSYDLKYTNANDFYTTKYRDFRSQIISTYHNISNIFSDVYNVKIDNREVLSPGVVEVTYENQVKFIINYTNKDFDYYGLTVKATDYIKIGGDVNENNK